MPTALLVTVALVVTATAIFDLVHQSGGTPTATQVAGDLPPVAATADVAAASSRSTAEWSDPAQGQVVAAEVSDALTGLIDEHASSSAVPGTMSAAGNLIDQSADDLIAPVSPAATRSIAPSTVPVGTQAGTATSERRDAPAAAATNATALSTSTTTAPLGITTSTSAAPITSTTRNTSTTTRPLSPSSSSTTSNIATTTRPLSTTTRAVSTTTVVASTTTTAAPTTTTRPSGDAGAPRRPPAVVCGNKSVLDGPDLPPAGATVVAAGDHAGLDWSRPDTTWWFAPGRHTLGTGRYDQIRPGDRSRFIGAPGAVIDGQRLNQYAFGGHATDVTISHLTIEGFGTPGANHNEGVVNHDAGRGWTIESSTVHLNAGAGVFLGHDNTIRSSCLHSNGQYGFSAYRPEGVRNLVLVGNEIAYNNTDDWEYRISGCGCTGGGKFWDVSKATIIDNWVHDNAGAGLWADTNNNDFVLDGNFIVGNHAEGFFYEISYNAIIKDNTFARNGWIKGPTNPGFPTGAIYLSEAGGDPRVAARTDAIEITGNLVVDNWAGVVAWESADRFCGSPANTSSGACTLVNPAVTIRECSPSGIQIGAAIDDCRWKTQRLRVHDNVFWMQRSAIPGCSEATSCGIQALFSQWGTYPDWSPYRGFVVADAVVRQQDNRFAANHYVGDWSFLVHHQGNVMDFASWRRTHGQDIGSDAA